MEWAFVLSDGPSVTFYTNHLNIWYRLAAICDASFDWRLLTPSLGEGVVVWSRKWVFWIG